VSSVPITFWAHEINRLVAALLETVARPWVENENGLILFPPQPVARRKQLAAFGGAAPADLQGAQMQDASLMALDKEEITFTHGGQKFRRPSHHLLSAGDVALTPHAAPLEEVARLGHGRFVELIDSGSSNNWDAHGDMVGGHAPLARNVDQAIAGLLKDLKARGLLKDTLVVWTTEFGRTPFNNSADAKGREHHPWAFSSWLAGGGVKAGHVHGATDEHGVRVAEKGVHVHDFHATILHLLGIDHERLTYRHAGRDYRLTDVSGEVVEAIMA